jgi:hypothetical protein
MQTQSVLLIVLAFVLALGIAYLFYKKSKTDSRLRSVLTSLRFLTLFSGLLLLINPEFVRNTYKTEKANLILLVDESSSISNLKLTDRVKELVGQLTDDEGLIEKFSIQSYTFSNEIQPLDSLAFKGKTTNIEKSLETIKETFANGNNAVILISDGNQTYGRDYEYVSLGNQSQLNTIVVGDTTSYLDVGIGLVNSNRYAFLNNQFPVEAQIPYSGETSVRTDFKITIDGRVVHRETINLSSNRRSQTVNVLLKAQNTGVKTITLELDPLDEEKNKENNRKEISIDVIDEKTTVGIVSSFKHPDIGALKKAIETNEQRQVELLSPSATVDQFEKVDVFILYQPNSTFEQIYEFIEQRGGGTFIITGTKTNWNYLQNKISGFTFESFGQNEEILPFKNNTFELFDSSNLEMSGYPPLNGALGEIQFSQEPNVIAYQQIRGVTLQEPLFFVLEGKERRAFLLGENIWKWRLQEYRNTQEFSSFDEVIGKLMFYLSSSSKKERLQLDYENIYESASGALIRASFFNKAYDFEKSANLNISLKGKDGFSRDVPMLLSGNQYQADLSDLEEGEYTFTVSETQERISKSGQFKILDFDLEKQFMSANHEKLSRLAGRNSGQLFYPNDTPQLVDELINNNQFLPIQKSTKNVVSLIDFRVVLGIMAMALALEWFLRKYNGLL